MNLGKVKIRKKSMIAIILLLTSLGIFIYQDQESKIEQETKIIVAKSYIPENTLVTEDMLKEELRRTDDLMKQKGDITSTFEKVVGKRAISPIYKEETVNLNRLTDNKEYMNEKDKMEKHLFVVPIDITDRALNIAKGSYIDIWLKPTENGELEGMKPYKIFDKYKVYDTKTEEYGKANNNQSSEEEVITYLTLYLTDKEIEEYLSVKDALMLKRITLHSKNMDFKIAQENIKERLEKQENEKLEIKEDNKE